MEIHSSTQINQTWNSTEQRYCYSFIFAFKSRSEHLAFRGQWKTHYFGLSELIRSITASIRYKMRRLEYAGKEQARWEALKQDATLELMMLNAAKVEANRQYLESIQAQK